MVLGPGISCTAGPGAAGGVLEGTEGTECIPYLGRCGLMGTPAKETQVIDQVSDTCQDALGWHSGDGARVSLDCATTRTVKGLVYLLDVPK